MADAPLEYALAEMAAGKIPSAAFDDWDAFDRRAEEHRLRPLLHHFHRDNAAIPQTIRELWATTYRASAITALHQRRELLEIAELCTASGLHPVALKGAWLAWNAWPDPALRPLRDLDLYLPDEGALRAREILLEKGWHENESEGLDQLGGEEWLARFKALPSLVSPGGVAVDLHVRLWDDDGRVPAPPDGLLERCIADADHPCLRYLAPIDQLMHLAIHATAHRFDGGPLMLADFGYLLAAEAFDWPAIRARADREGWRSHLALCLAAAKRWSGIEVLWPEFPGAVPGNLLEALPLLLCKPLEAREGDIAAAKLARKDIGLGEKLRRIRARRERHGSLRDYLGWVGSEVSAVARTSIRGSERSVAIAAFDDWLKS